MNNFERISSRNNANIKLICSLNESAKQRKKEGLFVLEGLRICLDALDNSVEFQSLFIEESSLKKLENHIKKLSLNSKKCYVVDDFVFKKISETKSSQGIIACVKIPENNYKPLQNGRYIALEDIQDPANMGAVCRTAEALGLSGIVITENCVDPFSPKSLRGSMGTLLRMPIFKTSNIINFAKENNLRTVSFVVNNKAKPVSSVSFSDGDIILIGNEGNGLKEETVLNSDLCVYINMQGSVESLNAATAASIAMWELMKK